MSVALCRTPVGGVVAMMLCLITLGSTCAIVVPMMESAVCLGEDPDVLHCLALPFP
jgi:hypothetical protein